MSVRKTVGGKFEANFYIHINGSRKRIRKIFATKNEAINFEAEARREKNHRSIRSVLGKNTRTIPEMIDYYFHLPRFNQLRPRSRDRNKQLLAHLQKWCNENHITYAHEFSRETANDYINSISERSKGKGRQHNVIVAKMVFAEELERDQPCISRNPFPKRSPFKSKKYAPIALPEVLINKLREHMTPLERSIYDLLYYTGARSAELLFLTWDQVTKATVKYGEHQIFNTCTNKWETWDTKTSAERLVPLNERSSDCFIELRRLNVQQGYVLPDVCRAKSHWILRTFTKIKQRTVRTYPELEEILFSKDKSKAISPKCYRSSFVTHIIRNTGNVATAKQLAGHSSISTTMGHYVDPNSLDTVGAVGSLDLDDRRGNRIL